MGKKPSLLTFLLAMVPSWIHRRQLMVIALLKAENRAINEKLKVQRIVFTEAERALRHAMSEFVARYHVERNRQGLKNTLIRAEPVVGRNVGVIHRRPRPGGMLDYYYRAAA
jgi:hypothetical protein